MQLTAMFLLVTRGDLKGSAQAINGLARRLGPGLITGAADDDPSGIATYSQAGSQFRFGLVWTLLLTTPLMIGIQMLSARIGWVTGEGLAANIAKFCPRWLTVGLVGLLVVANTINIAADIGAMGEAVRLLAGGPRVLYLVLFGVVAIVCHVDFSDERTVRILKWLTLALFAYVAVILSVSVPWRDVLVQGVAPWLDFPRDIPVKDYAAMVVAVLGTTISPYLFFWQASQEVEDNRLRPEAAELRLHPAYAVEHLFRIKQDTYVGMLFSNLIALCIVIATAVTLNLHGITNIQTSSQAAEALRPHRRRVRVRRLRSRHHRYGTAGRPGPGRIGRVRRERSIWLEGEPVAWLPRRARLLLDHHSRHCRRHADERDATRPDPGAGLERNCQRCHLGADHGRDDGDRSIEAPNGRAYDEPAASAFRLGGHTGDGRGRRLHAADELLGAAGQRTRARRIWPRIIWRPMRSVCAQCVPWRTTTMARFGHTPKTERARIAASP